MKWGNFVKMSRSIYQHQAIIMMKLFVNVIPLVLVLPSNVISCEVYMYMARMSPVNVKKLDKSRQVTWP